MFIRRIGRKNGSTMLKIIQNVRIGDQIKQKALCTVGVAKDLEQLKVLEAVAKTKMVEILNSRFPAIPGLEEIVHGSDDLTI